ncbi:MAG TPA: Coenzyme F420 hydrogenase/dehydrogenase, beta subunit C-terminal domain [Anaerolineales bacterium]|nr:Coenzyme F420 hydrogenase/dehydrogenase, beta subunit C-terminal domain [Anaerolineales bacterium]
MNVNRLLRVREGNATKTLQDFLTVWWKQVQLDAMLAPVETSDQAVTSPQIISQPDDLAKVNPFAPVMLNNTAAMIQDFVRDNPTSHLAVILRPCELRALVELRKRHRVCYQSVSSGNDQESLVVISVDCPGTFSEAEYTRHIANRQADAEMIHVELSYGKQDSYIPYEVRQTCQMCDSPGPLGADITIGTIGIESQGDLLVIARDEEIDSSLRLGAVTEGIATEYQVFSREMMVGKLVDKRAEKRSALMKSQTLETEDMTAALAMFARCTLCADCLDACPLYDGELAGMLGVGEGRQNGHPLFAELIRVSRWLASCSGCGMCRESCEQGIPITQMITVLSHRIQAELHYRPGDPSQRLPWMPERVG